MMSISKLLNKPAMAALLAAGLQGQVAHGQGGPADSIETAVPGGTAGIALRYRYEHVDQDGIAEDADASTLRFRLKYRTGTFRDWRGFAEFDYVGEVLLDEFNSGAGTSPDRGRYPVVADPDGADLNQLYIDYAGLDDTRLRFGRQRILLDNERFVGGVGWRQNEQTFDGFTATYDGLAAAGLQYAYIARVNRIFGERSAAGRHDNDTHLLHARIDLPDGWTLTPYGYYIDNDDLPAFSTMTLGARLNGEIAVGQETLKLTGEVARQADAASAPVDYTAGYRRFDASLTLGEAAGVGLGYEVLEGDASVSGAAFRTPLATLHAFQGWADQFLATPDAGVADLFLSARWSPAAWTLKAVWHRFAADAGSADWGEELDLSAQRRLGEHYSVLFKAALFDADNPAFRDVGKYWVMLTARY